MYLIISFRQHKKVKNFTDENLTLTDIYLPVVPDENFANVTRLLLFELWDPDGNFIKNLLFFPIKIIYILALPYESNPLILFCSQFLVIFFGLTLFFMINFNK